MRKYFFLFLSLAFFLFTRTAQAQVDYCTEMNKAVAAITSNFSSYNNYQFKTKGGQSAYLSDFSFVQGGKAYVYKDDIKKESFFFQSISTNPEDYQKIYGDLEKCLVRQTDRWTKLDGKEGKSVIFTCRNNGGNIILISGTGGVTVEIKRDVRKSIPVFNTDLCYQLERLTNACANNFNGVMGPYKDSSILGKRYDAAFHLNQRALSASITLGYSFLDKTKADNSYMEMISESDMKFADVVTTIENCLNGKGWVKTQPTANETRFTKDNVDVSLSLSQPYSVGEAADIFLRIGTKKSY